MLGQSLRMQKKMRVPPPPPHPPGSSFSQQVGLMYFTDQIFAQDSVIVKHNHEHQNPDIEDLTLVIISYEIY